MRKAEKFQADVLPGLAADVTGVSIALLSAIIRTTVGASDEFLHIMYAIYSLSDATLYLTPSSTVLTAPSTHPGVLCIEYA